MKKRIITMLCIVLVLCISGCKSDNGQEEQETQPKDQYYTVTSVEDGEVLCTIKDEDKIKTIETIISALDVSADGSTINVSGYTPQYQYICHQEKTQLAGENPDRDKAYEEILSITTYADANVITIEISPEVVKNMMLSEESMSFTHVVSKDTINSLNNIEQFR